MLSRDSMSKMGSPPMVDDVISIPGFTTCDVDETIFGRDVVAGKHAQFLIQLKFASANVNCALGTGDQSVRQLLSRDQHFRQQFADLRVNIVGIQDGHAR